MPWLVPIYDSCTSPATTRTNSDELSAFVQRLTRDRGLDAAVIAVPSVEVVREAQGLVRGAGQVLLFSHTKRGEGADIDLATICVDEKDLLGSYSADFTLQADPGCRHAQQRSAQPGAGQIPGCPGRPGSPAQGQS